MEIKSKHLPGLKLWFRLFDDEKVVNSIIAAIADGPDAFLEKVSSHDWRFESGGLFDPDHYRSFVNEPVEWSDRQAFVHYSLVGAARGCPPGRWLDFEFLKHEMIGSIETVPDNVFEFLSQIVRRDIPASNLVDFSFVRDVLSSFKIKLNLENTLTSYDILKFLGNPKSSYFPLTSLYYWTSWIRQDENTGILNPRSSPLRVASICAASPVGGSSKEANPWFSGQWIKQIANHKPGTVGELMDSYIRTFQFQWIDPDQAVDLLYELRKLGIADSQLRDIQPYAVFLKEKWRMAALGQYDNSISLEGKCIRSFMDPEYYQDNNKKNVCHSDNEIGIRTSENHYIAVGSAAGISPVPWFDEKSYLSLHPDVDTAVQEGNFISGFAHYVLHGRVEGREVAISGGQSSVAPAVRVVRVSQVDRMGVAACIELAVMSSELTLRSGDSETSRPFAMEIEFVQPIDLIKFVVTVFSEIGPVVVVLFRPGEHPRWADSAEIDLRHLMHPDRILVGDHVAHVTDIMSEGGLTAESLSILFESVPMIAFRADAIVS